ncbi:21 kDa protein-like [Ananas comosus]|uniref:21 kDa protein-like n=1 Tax=Ananas comosus TaxID=4615 RepID=A0A6P5EM74_ANACO|nr:21 kDa protein-like [Ananas comosus]
MASRTLFFSFFVFVLLLPEFEASITSALGEGRRSSTSSSSSSSPAPGPRNSTAFIRASCGATLYPRLCYASLSTYADSVAESPVALARLASNVTAARLRALSARVAALRRRRAAPPPREAAALRDCCESAGDAADLARRAGAELARLDAGAAAAAAAGSGAAWRVANAQTWLSAALTNEDTCADGFDAVAPGPGSAKGEVLARVRRVKQYTSNALALVNTLVAATHGP